MSNDAKQDFLFAFQTMLLADVARKPCSWDSGDINVAIQTALERSKEDLESKTPQELIGLASEILLWN